jgi:dTDP-4-amino-4,6-dideoxygalactose transaminase
LDTGKVTNFSKYVTTFEEQTSEYLGAHVATLSSGTQGLIFALQALGLERGQEVIVPSFTFMATAQAVLYAGGTPVFAEVTDDLTLSPDDLEALMDHHKDIGVVIGVHMYGLPCSVGELEQIIEVSNRKRGRKVALLFDAAHAFGSAINGARVGIFGDAEVFSLSVTKALVSVEGGLVSSRNPDLIRRIKKMRNYGIEANYDTHYPGLNGKMSEFHAIVGLYNLARLEEYMAARQRSARYYTSAIGSRTGFKTLPWPQGITHTFKDFSVLTPDHLDGRRDDVTAILAEWGVETRAYFHPPVHQQKFFRKYADRCLPRTEALSRRVITLPFYTSINASEMDYVVDAMADAERKLA